MKNKETSSRQVRVPGTVYLVGGAVREKLLRTDLMTDKDWVVVGATTEEMYTAGFTLVGGHFPVFLHPISKEEYALARTEKKQGSGHKGFVVDSSPDVTIEDDLRRRDLTINAIAIRQDSTVIDPCRGLEDLRSKTLRHVSEAFIEDPLRVYRVARFAALLPDFEIAHETLDMMTKMSAELSTLSAERVWAECAKAMRGLTPYRFFETISKVGAVDPWFSDLTILSLVGIMREQKLRHLNAIAAIGWFHDEETVNKFCRQLKVPGKVFRLIREVARHGQALCELKRKTPEDVLHVLLQSHAMRPGDAFTRLIDAVEALSSIDLSAIRNLVKHLKLLRVVGKSAEEYGTELRNRRLKYIKTHFIEQ